MGIERYKDMKDNKDKVVYRINVLEERKKKSCGCTTCQCDNSVVRRREITDEVKKTRDEFWALFKK